MIDEVPVGLRPGDARCPGPGYIDIAAADPGGAPAPLHEQSYEFEGDHDLAFSRYTSRDFAALEHERMWSRTWQWACREEHIPNVGDYYVYDIGDRSLIVIRTADGIKAYNNFCLHRGTQLRASGSQGRAKQFRCPFHGWTWDTNGTNIDVPCRWDFPHLSDEDLRLPEARVGQWGGFVWVNFDPQCVPLEEYLGVLPRHFAHWDLSDRYVEVHVRKQLPANWKASMEAFLEAYHVLETHWQAVKTNGDANAQYDVFGEHITRFAHTTASPSPHVDPKPTEDEMLDLIFARKNPGEPRPQRAPGQTARDVYAAYIQQVYGERYKRDLSQLTVAETIDSIEYFVFPNAFFFPGITIPMVYRFRPNADPDSTTFELLMMRPKPSDGSPVPKPSAPFDLSVDDSWTLVPGMEESLARVYDQDTGNLAAQTRGFKGSMKRGQSLGNYQEIRARHLHTMVDRYLARPL